MKLVDLYRQYLIDKDNTSELNIALANLKAQCLSNLIDISIGDTRDAIQASKYLLEFSLENTRGRPSKADILNETKRIIDTNALVEDAYSRLGLDDIALRSNALFGTNALQEVKE